MPHFELTDRPILPPTMCAVCRTHPTPENPFVDTRIDLPGLGTGSLAQLGHLYLCRLCVRAAALLVGMLAPEDKERLEREAAEATREASDARAALEAARDVKTVRLSDLRRVVGEQVRELVTVGARGSEAEPEPEPEARKRGKK